MLKKLLNKNSLTVIGLNAGTSADGLDLAAVRINLTGHKINSKFIEGATVIYTKNLREKVHLAIANKLSLDELLELDRQLGHFYGQQAINFIKRLKEKKVRPDIIASHGQTVRHLPGRFKINGRKASGTLQLGHPETISELTGLVTVADFRQADIAAGGEGAPITSYPMWQLFADKKSDRLLINIGGIANYFFLPHNSPPDKIMAKDCGPGNTLLDLATEKYFGKKYDYGGQLASIGNISRRLLSILLSDKFLKGKFGPSTGRERFGFEFLEKVERSSAKLKLDENDILATLTELTAMGIKTSLLPILKKYAINEIYLFGGGVHNLFLIDRLIAHINNGIVFFKVDRFRLNSDYLEAICYALLGAMTLHTTPAGLPDITGANRRAVCGRIVQPSIK